MFAAHLSPVPMEPLKVGELVFLRSGSPQMIITLIEGDTAHCTWYAGNRQHRASHPLAFLVRASDYLAGRGPGIEAV